MSTTTMRGLNKAELKMNLDIPPFRRSNISTVGAAAFPSVLLPVTTATTTTTTTGPAATAAGGVAESSTCPSDGLGIRGLSSEPPVTRPTKRRSGTQESLERDTSRARTRSPEMSLSAVGRASRPAGVASGAQASSSTNATASTSSSSKSALSALTNDNTNTSGSNKRARTSLSVSHGSTIDSLASVASEALQTFPIPSPNVLSQSAGASTSSSGPQERRSVTTRRPSFVSRTSIPTDNYPAVPPKSEDLSGSRSAEPSYVNKVGTSTNSSLDPVRENKDSPGSLSQRRGETAAGKGLKITTLPTGEVVEQAPRTAPGNIVTGGPLGPNGPTGQVSGKGHGRRGTSFNGQGQFMAQARNPGGGPHASLPTPLQAIPVSPYTVAPTQGQPSLHTQYSQQASHNHSHGHSHSYSHSRHSNLPPMSVPNSASATRHGSVSGAPVLDPYYAPTVTGTYSVPIPHSQHRSSISSTPGSTATYLPPHQTIPATSSSISASNAYPSSSSASTSSIMETSKHAFLAHFSTLYDAFHETRTLSRSLDHELGRARMILNQLDEGWIDTLVRRENERLWNRVVELERIVEEERRLCSDRLGRLERAFLADSNGLSSATTTTMSSSAPSSASVSAGPVGATGLGFASLGSVGRRRGSDSLGTYTMLPTMGLGIGNEENTTSVAGGGGSSNFSRGMEEEGGGPGGLEMDESSSVVVGGTGPFIKRERGGTPLPPLMTTGSLVPRRRSVMSRPGTATSSTSSGSMNEFGAGGGGAGGLRNGMSGTGNSARRSSMNTSQGPRGEDVEMSGPGVSGGGRGHGHEGRD